MRKAQRRVIIQEIDRPSFAGCKEEKEYWDSERVKIAVKIREASTWGFRVVVLTVGKLH